LIIHLDIPEIHPCLADEIFEKRVYVWNSQCHAEMHKKLRDYYYYFADEG